MSKKTRKRRSAATTRPGRSNDKPWKGNPEKEQRNDVAGLDLEKWQKSSTR
jgi:hypothetical protein